MSHPVVTLRGLRAAWGRTREFVLRVVIPAAFAIAFFEATRETAGQFGSGFDYRGTLWEPARLILQGHSPYPDSTAGLLDVGNPAVYPPLFMLLSVPFALLPWGLAILLWMAALELAVVVALRLLGVTDWRCYALALLSPPVVHGVILGNLTLLLIVPVALAWRYRDRPLAVGAAVGFAIAAKLFLWPLVVWLVLTRRLRAATVALASCAALIFAPWAVIGFDGLRSYPDLLRELERAYSGHSFSLATGLSGLGFGGTATTAACAALAVALLGLAAFVARRRDGDRLSFTVAIAAAVVSSPIVWPSYVALLIVPLAVVRPRFSLVWVAIYGTLIVPLLPRAEVTSPIPCCPPPGVPDGVWAFNHGPPDSARAFGLVVAALALMVLIVRRASEVREA